MEDNSDHDFFAENVSLVSDFEYDVENQFNMQEFYTNFKDNLPKLVIVTEGYYGQTKFDDFSSDQVIRLQRTCKQQRALGRYMNPNNRREQFISIPVDGKFRFKVVNGPDEGRSCQTMEDILAENELPVKVQYVDKYSVRLPYALQNISAGKIEIIKTYTEDFFQGNCLQDGVLSPIISLVALSPLMSVSVITGYTNRPKESFESKMKAMDVFVKNNVTYKENDGSPDMTIFERRAETTGTGNIIPPDLLPEPVPEWAPPIPERVPKRPALPPRPKGVLHRPKEKNQFQHTGTDNEQCSLNPGPIYDSIRDDDSFDSGNESWSTGSRSYVTEKSVQGITEVLESLKLSKYSDIFRDQLIDGAILQELNEDILRKEFNFRHVEAVRLMKYVRSGHIPK